MKNCEGESALHDLRFAVRLLCRNGASTAVIVVALAIGIAVNTTVFTAYKTLVLRQLDARAPGEMVNVALVRDSGATDNTFSYPDYEAYRDAVQSLSGLVAFRLDQLTLSADGAGATARSLKAGNAERATVYLISENYFEVLGVRAVEGRTLDSMSVREAGADPPVLISENYWRRRFDADPAILGKIVRLNGVRVTVIGIAPRDFIGTGGVTTPGFWAPIAIEPLLQGDDDWLRRREDQRYRLYGRLAPGTSLSQAQAEMNAIANRIRTLHDPRSDSAKPATMLVWPGSQFPLPLNQYGPGPKLFVQLVMVAAGIVLAVACANVGSLQLARSRSRQSELRTRLALGASRVRIIRQLLTESLLIGLSAGALALLFTWIFLRASVTLIANVLPLEFGTFVLNVDPDFGIFMYVSAISAIAGLISGFAPAMESSRSALAPQAKGATSSARSRRLQDLFIAVQVAFSVVLLIAGTMSVRSSIQALAIDPGYESDRLTNIDLQLPAAGKYTAERKLSVYREVRSRLADLPGVVGITAGRPPGMGYPTAAVAFDPDHASAQSGQSLVVQYAYVQAGYFQTVSMPVLLGRSFRFDAGPEERSVVISESAARLLWQSENPIGRKVRLGPTDERLHNLTGLVATGATYEIIGVVRDTRGTRVDGGNSRSIYMVLPESRFLDYPLLVRTQSDPASLLKSMTDAISSADPDAVARLTTLKEMLRASPPFITSTIAAGIASSVGLLALLLASMGIYGTVAYIVVLRTREVGIRIAIGAQRGNVLSLILRETFRPVLAGLIAGILLAAGASYALRGFLYGLNGVDSGSSILVSTLFLLIALAASYLPARRAVRIDPIVALRYE
jgi:putative ABC transport system permease protein